MTVTIVDILGFTQKMIAAETEYVADRALFSTQQFIDITHVLPEVISTDLDSQFVFDSFLSETFDGIGID